jgi:predicted component of type VI protein secretion system
MTQESLRELLQRVHERLNRSGSVDSQSRELLTTVMRDIDRALNRSSAKPSDQVDAAPRLEALAVRFESEHPALAGVLRQLIDALGKAGI